MGQGAGRSIALFGVVWNCGISLGGPYLCQWFTGCKKEDLGLNVCLFLTFSNVFLRLVSPNKLWKSPEDRSEEEQMTAGTVTLPKIRRWFCSRKDHDDAGKCEKIQESLWQKVLDLLEIWDETVQGRRFWVQTPKLNSLKMVQEYEKIAEKMFYSNLRFMIRDQFWGK